MLSRTRPLPSGFINVNGTAGISVEIVWLKGNIDSKFAR
jgi:hypothetical protein